MTNRERLENAGIVDPDATWSQQQTNAIESLTAGEVDALISVKDKVDDVFPLTGEPAAPIQRFS